MRARQRFAYNGYDLTAHVAVTSVSRSILPSRRLNRQELPGADGELAVASGLDSLEIKVACSLKASTLEEVSSRRRMLSAELLSGGAAQLILPDEPHLWLVAIYEGGAELSRNANMPSMELTFLVPDPVAYGEERRVSIDGSGSISVGGTAPTSPVVRASAPSGPSWSVKNASSGELVEVPGPFTGGEEIVVDMGLCRCTVDGEDRAVTLDSDFFAISGSQRVELSGGSAELSWTERWA